MTDNSLSTTYQEIAAQVGRYLGFGRGFDVYAEEVWTSKMLRDIKDFIKSGLRQFYNTPPIPQVDPGGYEWSFLTPTATLTLASGSSTIELPDDYASVSGQLMLAASSDRVSLPINFYGVPAVNTAYTASPTATGQPQMACEEPIKARTSVFGQKMRLKVWPIADQEYNVEIPYRINAPALTGDFPYAYGGAQHAETIIAACIAAAELGSDDKLAERKAYFTERLVASIQLDRLNKPQFMGRNRDSSDTNDRWGRPAALRGEGLVTINGVSY